MDPVQLELARQQIKWSRDYTNQLIDGVPEQQWFDTPLSYPTHIAWQVGHLAMAEYGLTMLRIRGREPDDEHLIPKDFLRRFKKSSVPSTTASSSVAMVNCFVSPAVPLKFNVCAALS